MEESEQTSPAVRNRSISKRISRALLLFLAVLFVFEAWLWEKTGRLIGWMAEHIPFKRLMHWLDSFISSLSPLATLGVFVVPAIVLFPLKVLGMWFFTTGHFFAGLGVAALSKLLGFGVSSYLFHRCKPKLLQLRLVRWIYAFLIGWYDKAQRFIAPYKQKVQAAMKAIRAKLPKRGEAMRLLMRLRRIIKKDRAL